jgi:hypothetical protein
LAGQQAAAPDGHRTTAAEDAVATSRRPRVSARSLARTEAGLKSGQRMRAREVARQAIALAVALWSLPACAADRAGTSSSALSWSVVGTGPTARFSPRRDDLGRGLAPSSVALVKLVDARPYGGPKTCSAWLLRFERVEVVQNRQDTTTMAVTLAYDAQTHDMLCAFTDASSKWTGSALTSAQIEDRGVKGHSLAMARYDSLHSTVTGVLEAYVGAWGPELGGQVILRPRSVDGENQWVWEEAGRVVLVTFPPPASAGPEYTGPGRKCTVIVGYIRDRDLKLLGGPYLP